MQSSGTLGPLNALADQKGPRFSPLLLFLGVPVLLIGTTLQFLWEAEEPIEPLVEEALHPREKERWEEEQVPRYPDNPR